MVIFKCRYCRTKYEMTTMRLPSKQRNYAKCQAGLPVSREHAAPRPKNAVNLMEALRRSIAQGKAASPSPTKGRKRIEGQGEMLLPIAGRKGKQAIAKPAERAGARQENAG